MDNKITLPEVLRKAGAFLCFQIGAIDPYIERFLVIEKVDGALDPILH